MFHVEHVLHVAQHRPCQTCVARENKYTFSACVPRGTCYTGYTMRKATITVTLEAETEARVQKIEDHYGSLCSRTSVGQTAMELGLLLMAAELSLPLLAGEKEQLKKRASELAARKL